MLALIARWAHNVLLAAMALLTIALRRFRHLDIRARNQDATNYRVATQSWEGGGGTSQRPGRETGAGRMRPAGSPGMANPGLQQCRDSIASHVFPAAATGETHASNGHTRTYAPGLRGAWTAQRNGSTATRTVTERDHLYSGKFIFFKNALYRGSPSSFFIVGSPLMLQR